MKNIFSKAEYKRIGGNVLSLMLLNGIYFLSPLILIPYLMRTIGAEFYGIYIFSWTIIYYFIFIVNYGFDLSSTRDIAINRYDLVKVSTIYSTTLYSRIFLLCLSILMLFLLTVIVDKLNANAQLLLLGIGVIAGQALFPTWLFQGMEEMKFITIVNSIIRILPIIFIFIFVKSESDIEYIIGFQSLGYIIGGLFSHFFAVRHFKLKITKPNFQSIKENLQSAWSLFLSTVGVSLYREVNTVILGFVTNNFILVGYYSLADKFIRIVQLIANSISQALFPFFGHSLTHNKKEALLKFRRVGLLYALFLLLTTIVLYLTIPWLVRIYLNGDFPEIVMNVRIMSPIILIGGLNYFFGVVGLVNLNHKNAFTGFVLIAGAVNILLAIFLSKTYLDAGAAFSLTVAELILFILILVYFQLKEKIL